jgi:SAM-dependent MidA family methyltransferase
MDIAEWLSQKINRDGPISFHDFMEQALYHPELGYYNNAKEKIGEQGDFYTSPHYTSIFGHLIARQLQEMWQWLGKGGFTIVEFGAGYGLMCQDILNGLKPYRECYDQVSYCIIEKSSFMRNKQADLLKEKVSWFNDLREIPPIRGCILANEVIDNFAVSRVIQEAGQLLEILVDFDGAFIERTRPAPAALSEYFRELGVELPAGYKAEVSLEAIAWIREAARALDRGFVLTIDYGNASQDLYSKPNSGGTIRCYRQHQMNECPYIYPGQQDITAQVNFSALHHFGLQNGLLPCGYTSQIQFLQGLGMASCIQLLEKEDRFQRLDRGDPRGWIKNFLLDMGRKFKVFIQQKGLSKPLLSGLQFGQGSVG